MKNRHHIASLPALPSPPQIRHPALAAKNSLQGCRSSKNNNSGIDQGELLVQPGATGLQFLPPRSTVPRGAAFDGIANVEITLGLKADLHQQPVEGLAGSADEGLTGGVLARSWGFANQHQARARIATAHHHLLAGRREVAGSATAAGTEGNEWIRHRVR